MGSSTETVVNAEAENATGGPTDVAVVRSERRDCHFTSCDTDLSCIPGRQHGSSAI